MRVLLTRAAEDAARTRVTLERLGHHVLVSPVIAIEPTCADWPSGVVDAVLATSGHAFVANAEDWGPKSEARRLMPLWFVGQRTQEAARTRGFQGPSYVAPDAVSLAFEMSKLRTQDRIVYLAGRNRKPDIETALSVMDQAIEVVEVYEAKSIDHLDIKVAAALAENRIDAILHFSRRSASLFVEIVAQAGLTVRAEHFCLANDVAAPLTDAGWEHHVAAEPTEASLIAALPLF